jgi:hypothetical protein
MLESIYLANELKKKYETQNNFKYDCVIRCRFDITVDIKIKFEDYDTNNIYVINPGDHNPNTKINDWFAFSSSKNMDVWCDLFNNIKIVAENVNLIHNIRKIDNHILYAQWSIMNQLNIVPTDLKIDIYRVQDDSSF